MSATEPSQPASRPPPPTAPCPRSTPEEQGIPSDAVLRMVRRWEDEGNEPHGVVVIRHGHVVAEGAWQPWPRDGIRLVYSVSKTFLAMAAAFAEAEGLLARDERLVDVFPEAAAAAGPRAARLTVEDCLRMSTGHHVDTLDTVPGLAGGGEEAVAPFLRPSPRRSPARGSCTTTAPAGCWPWRCSAAPASGCVDYLRPRLLDPIGVTRRRVDAPGPAPTWASAGCTSPPTRWPGWACSCSRTASGRAGSCCPPAGWPRPPAALADTSHHPDPADWRVGYGYQMWRSRHGFRADGAYGQFALVLPQHDLVVAVTSCTETTHEVLDAVWDELLPHLSRRPAAGRSRCAGTARGRPSRRPRRRHAGPPPPRRTTDGPWTFTHTPTPEHPVLRSVVVRRSDDRLAARGRRRRAAAHRLR